MTKDELLALLRDDPDVRAALRDVVTVLVTEPPPPNPAASAAVASLRAAIRRDADPPLPPPIRARSSTPEDRRPGWLR